MVLEGRAKREKTMAGIADDRQERCFAASGAHGIETDDLGFMRDGGPGAGGEILQAGADARMTSASAAMVLALSERSRRRADIERLIGEKIGASGNGFDTRNPWSLGRKAVSSANCARILHAAAGNDHRAFGLLEKRCGVRDLRAYLRHARGCDAPSFQRMPLDSPLPSPAHPAAGR